MEWNSSTAVASASERETGFVLARIPGAPDIWKQIAVDDLLFLDSAGRAAMGGVAANYNFTNYLGGANANYFQIANGSTGAGAAVGLLVGIKADGTAHINSQGDQHFDIDVAGQHRARFDKATGDFLMMSTGGALGYGGGAAATQSTSKSTGVTVNQESVQVTMHNASLAAATAVSFTLTNDKIAANDTLIVNIKSGGTAGAYHVCADQISAGSARISVRNLTAGALGEALVLQINVIRGAIA